MIFSGPTIVAGGRINSSWMCCSDDSVAMLPAKSVSSANAAAAATSSSASVTWTPGGSRYSFSLMFQSAGYSILMYLNNRLFFLSQRSANLTWRDGCLTGLSERGRCDREVSTLRASSVGCTGCVIVHKRTYRGDPRCVICHEGACGGKHRMRVHMG